MKKYQNRIIYPDGAACVNTESSLKVEGIRRERATTISKITDLKEKISFRVQEEG